MDERSPTTVSQGRDGPPVPAVMTAFCLDRTSACKATLRTDVRVPAPQPHEALIRVRRAGICGTDLAMMNNYKPGFEGALGHEFVGVVVRVGEAVATAREWLGKRVVGELNIPCNDTDSCGVCSRAHEKVGSTAERDPAILHRNHCPHRDALGIVGRSGAFAEYITLPVANLLVVPDHVTDSVATFTEPLAAAYRIVEQAIIQPSDSVAVLGDGRLGLLVAEVLAVERVARQVTLIGKHAEKLALVGHLVETRIAYHTSPTDASSASAGSVPNEMFRERFDVVVECTGTAGGISTALAIVASHGGRIIMKSTCAVPKTEISSEALAMAVRKGVHVIGSRCGPFAPALAALAANRVDVTKFLAAVYPLVQAQDATAHASQRGVLKVQLDLAP